MGAYILFPVFFLPALGNLEYTQEVVTPDGVGEDEFTPLRRTYTLSDKPETLEIAGPLELTLEQGDVPFLTVQASPGLLSQIYLQFEEGRLKILLEPGLGGPLEKGRIKVHLKIPGLDALLLRSGVVGTLKLTQEKPLSLELRDRVFLRAEIFTPELRGLLTWKSEVRLQGTAPKNQWTLQGLSSLKAENLQWEEFILTQSNHSLSRLGLGNKLSGELRGGSVLEVAPDQDTTQIRLREESQVVIFPSP